jgi:hypothetical protein
MSAIEFVIEAGHRLPRSILDRSGEFLYSGVQTLRPGPIYLLGLNPGGDPKRHPDTVRDRLNELPHRRWNSYLVGWGGRDPGTHPLQRSVRWLASELGVTLEDVCASNLIFVRSPDERSSGFPDTAHKCWPVHLAILEVVRPRLVVTFGKSPYNFLRDELGAESEATPFSAGHATWQCRAFGSGGIQIVGLPHLSVYAIHKHPNVGRWLRSLMNNPPNG